MGGGIIRGWQAWLGDRRIMVDLDNLLSTVVEVGASDLHMAASNPPVVRVNGVLKIVGDNGVLSPQEISQILFDLIGPEAFSTFENAKEIDFSYGEAGLARFRVNACYQRGTISLSFRVLPPEVPTAQQLGLPQICLEMVSRLSGMVLVTGPTGSGKSSTLAAMVDHINETQSCRIITLEDPIEYVHKNKKSMIIQRQIGDDTLSFSESLRRALRQDPDVIMIGEMRDLESVSLALAAAETGHLVLGTLHTNGAAECVERMVGIFPADQQEQVRYQLSIGLSGVVFQALLPRSEGRGRIAAFEVMVGTSAIKNLIRQNQLAQIRTFMFMGGSYGMQTLEQSLVALTQQGLITKDEAYSRAGDRSTFEKLMAPTGPVEEKEE